MPDRSPLLVNTGVNTKWLKKNWKALALAVFGAVVLIIIFSGGSGSGGGGGRNARPTGAVKEDKCKKEDRINCFKCPAPPPELDICSDHETKESCDGEKYDNGNNACSWDGKCYSRGYETSHCGEDKDTNKGWCGIPDITDKCFYCKKAKGSDDWKNDLEDPEERPYFCQCNDTLSSKGIKNSNPTLNRDSNPDLLNDEGYPKTPHSIDPEHRSPEELVGELNPFLPNRGNEPKIFNPDTDLLSCSIDPTDFSEANREHENCNLNQFWNETLLEPEYFNIFEKSPGYEDSTPQAIDRDTIGYNLLEIPLINERTIDSNDNPIGYEVGPHLGEGGRAGGASSIDTLTTDNNRYTYDHFNKLKRDALVFSCNNNNWLKEGHTFDRNTVQKLFEDSGKEWSDEYFQDIDGNPIGNGTIDYDNLIRILGEHDISKDELSPVFQSTLVGGNPTRPRVWEEFPNNKYCKLGELISKNNMNIHNIINSCSGQTQENCIGTCEWDLELNQCSGGANQRHINLKLENPEDLVNNPEGLEFSDISIDISNSDNIIDKLNDHESDNYFITCANNNILTWKHKECNIRQCADGYTLNPENSLECVNDNDDGVTAPSTRHVIHSGRCSDAAGNELDIDAQICIGDSEKIWTGIDLCKPYCNETGVVLPFECTSRCELNAYWQDNDGEEGGGHVVGIPSNYRLKNNTREGLDLFIEEVNSPSNSSIFQFSQSSPTIIDSFDHYLECAPGYTTGNINSGGAGPIQVGCNRVIHDNVLGQIQSVTDDLDQTSGEGYTVTLDLENDHITDGEIVRIENIPNFICESPLVGHDLTVHRVHRNKVIFDFPIYNSGEPEIIPNTCVLKKVTTEMIDNNISFRGCHPMTCGDHIREINRPDSIFNIDPVTNEEYNNTTECYRSESDISQDDIGNKILCDNCIVPDATFICGSDDSLPELNNFVNNYCDERDVTDHNKIFKYKTEPITIDLRASLSNYEHQRRNELIDTCCEIKNISDIYSNSDPGFCPDGFMHNDQLVDTGSLNIPLLLFPSNTHIHDKYDAGIDYLRDLKNSSETVHVGEQNYPLCIPKLCGSEGCANGGGAISKKINTGGNAERESNCCYQGDLTFTYDPTNSTGVSETGTHQFSGVVFSADQINGKLERINNQYKEGGLNTESFLDILDLGGNNIDYLNQCEDQTRWRLNISPPGEEPKKWWINGCITQCQIKDDESYQDLNHISKDYIKNIIDNAGLTGANVDIHELKHSTEPIVGSTVLYSPNNAQIPSPYRITAIENGYYTLESETTLDSVPDVPREQIDIPSDRNVSNLFSSDDVNHCGFNEDGITPCSQRQGKTSCEIGSQTQTSGIGERQECEWSAGELIVDGPYCNPAADRVGFDNEISSSSINRADQLEFYSHAGNNSLLWNKIAGLDPLSTSRLLGRWQEGQRVEEQGDYDAMTPEEQAALIHAYVQDTFKRDNLLHYPRNDPKNHSLNAYCDNDTLKFTGCDVKLNDYAYRGSINEDVCNNAFTITGDQNEDQINCQNITSSNGVSADCVYTPPEPGQEHGECDGPEITIMTHSTEIFKPDMTGFPKKYSDALRRYDNGTITREEALAQGVSDDMLNSVDRGANVPQIPGEFNQWVDCSKFIEYINHKILNDDNISSIYDEPKYPYIFPDSNLGENINTLPEDIMAYCSNPYNTIFGSREYETLLDGENRYCSTGWWPMTHTLGIQDTLVENCGIHNGNRPACLENFECDYIDTGGEGSCVPVEKARCVQIIEQGLNNSTMSGLKYISNFNQSPQSLNKPPENFPCPDNKEGGEQAVTNYHGYRDNNNDFHYYTEKPLNHFIPEAEREQRVAKFADYYQKKKINNKDEIPLSSLMNCNQGDIRDIFDMHSVNGNYIPHFSTREGINNDTIPDGHLLPGNLRFRLHLNEHKEIIKSGLEYNNNDICENGYILQYEDLPDDDISYTDLQDFPLDLRNFVCEPCPSTSNKDYNLHAAEGSTLVCGYKGEHLSELDNNLSQLHTYLNVTNNPSMERALTDPDKEIIDYRILPNQENKICEDNYIYNFKCSESAPCPTTSVGDRALDISGACVPKVCNITGSESGTEADSDLGTRGDLDNSRSGLADDRGTKGIVLGNEGFKNYGAEDVYIQAPYNETVYQVTIDGEDSESVSSATCTETATTSVEADAAACAAVTDLDNRVACEAVRTTGANSVAACTYTPASTKTPTKGYYMDNQFTTEENAICSGNPKVLNQRCNSQLHDNEYNIRKNYFTNEEGDSIHPIYNTNDIHDQISFSIKDPCVNHIDSASYFTDMESCLSHTLESNINTIDDISNLGPEVENSINHWIPFDVDTNIHTVGETNNLMDQKSNLNQISDFEEVEGKKGICIEKGEMPNSSLFETLFEIGFNPGYDDVNNLNLKLLEFFNGTEDGVDNLIGTGSRSNANKNEDSEFGFYLDNEDILLTDTDLILNLRKRVTRRFTASNEEAYNYLNGIADTSYDAQLHTLWKTAFVNEVTDIYNQVISSMILSSETEYRDKGICIAKHNIQDGQGCYNTYGNDYLSTQESCQPTENCEFLPLKITEPNTHNVYGIETDAGNMYTHWRPVNKTSTQRLQVPETAAGGIGINNDDDNNKVKIKGNFPHTNEEETRAWLNDINTCGWVMDLSLIADNEDKTKYKNKFARKCNRTNYKVAINDELQYTQNTPEIQDFYLNNVGAPPSLSNTNANNNDFVRFEFENDAIPPQYYMYNDPGLENVNKDLLVDKGNTPEIISLCTSDYHTGSSILTCNYNIMEDSDVKTNFSFDDGLKQIKQSYMGFITNNSAGPNQDLYGLNDGEFHTKYPQLINPDSSNEEGNVLNRSITGYVTIESREEEGVAPTVGPFNYPHIDWGGDNGWVIDSDARPTYTKDNTFVESESGERCATARGVDPNVGCGWERASCPDGKGRYNKNQLKLRKEAEVTTCAQQLVSGDSAACEGAEVRSATCDGVATALGEVCSFPDTNSTEAGDCPAGCTYTAATKCTYIPSSPGVEEACVAPLVPNDADGYYNVCIADECYCSEGTEMSGLHCVPPLVDVNGVIMNVLRPDGFNWGENQWADPPSKYLDDNRVKGCSKCNDLDAYYLGKGGYPRYNKKEKWIIGEEPDEEDVSAWWREANPVGVPNPAGDSLWFTIEQGPGQHGWAVDAVNMNNNEAPKNASGEEIWDNGGAPILNDHNNERDETHWRNNTNWCIPKKGARCGPPCSGTGGLCDPAADNIQDHFGCNPNRVGNRSENEKKLFGHECKSGSCELLGRVLAGGAGTMGYFCKLPNGCAGRSVRCRAHDFPCVIGSTRYNAGLCEPAEEAAGVLTPGERNTSRLSHEVSDNFCPTGEVCYDTAWSPTESDPRCYPESEAWQLWDDHQDQVAEPLCDTYTNDQTAEDLCRGDDQCDWERTALSYFPFASIEYACYEK